jgi:muconate cycloisomerase
LAVIGAIRDALGDDVRLRVDYNQAYSMADAVEAIRAIEPFGIDCAEQPVAAADYPGMAGVQRQVDTPLMAHEGCFSLEDIQTLAALGGIGVVGVNAERPGGLTRALSAVDFAAGRDMGVVIHNQSLGISSSAQAHLAAARWDALGHAPELFGHVMFEDDLVADGLDYTGGRVRVLPGPGFGVELDADALDRYATGPTVVMEVS